MTGALVPAFDAALTLARALEAGGVPYAIGGAIALGAWSDPRATHEVDINIFVDPFAWEAMRTKRRLTGPAGAAEYLSAEAIAVFKLLFFRAKDLVDVERLVLVQQGDLDRAYVRGWLVDMMGADDERVRAWDDIVARAAAPPP